MPERTVAGGEKAAGTDSHGRDLMFARISVALAELQPIFGNVDPGRCRREAEVRGRRSGVGGRMSEFRGQNSEVRDQSQWSVAGR